MSTIGANDADLVHASRGGDCRAFGEIVARYQSLICSLAYSVIAASKRANAVGIRLAMPQAMSKAMAAICLLGAVVAAGAQGALGDGCVGSLDPGFDAGSGPDDTGWSPWEDWNPQRPLVVQPNGQILLGGSFSHVQGVSRTGVVRFQPEGVVDTGFSPVLTGAGLEVRAIVLQPDGKVLLGGVFSAVNGISRPGLARLGGDGSLDESFHPQFEASEPPHFWALAQQSDGKVVACGYVETSDQQIFRFHPDGRLDDSFHPTNRFAGLSFVLLQSDGGMLVNGLVHLEGGVPIQTRVVARLRPDGSLDDSFVPPALPDVQVKTALLQPDGKLLLGFEKHYPPAALRSQPHYGSVLRLNPDGSLDTAFTTNLVFETDARPAERVGPMVCALGLQADGRILVAGGFDYVNRIRRTCVIRLHLDGALDPGFETDIAYHPNSDDVEYVSELAFAPQGNLLIGGFFSQVNGVSRPGLARLHLAENACPGVIAFSTDLYLAHESAGELAITVVRRGDLSRTAGATYATVGYDTTLAGWARSGEDFIAATNRLEFGPGESAQTLRIPILHNRSWETDETLVVVLSEPTGGTLLGYPASARIVIQDHESAGQPGSLDDRFTSPFVFGPIADFFGVKDIQAQADGRILIAGGFTLAGCSRCGGLARLNADGALDGTFAPQIAGEVWAVQLQTNGRIVIGGDFKSVNGTPRTNLARLEANGQLDPGFAVHPGGLVSHIARQADGRLIIAGFLEAGPGEWTNFVRRLQADGSTDASYLHTVAIVSGGNEQSDVAGIHALEIQPDGKVLLAGQFFRADGVPRPGLLRLNEDGSLDEGFVPAASGGRDIALQPDGRVLVAGAASLTDPIRTDVVRLESNGSLDATFNASTQPPRAIQALALQPDGRVVVGGLFGHSTSSILNLARLNPDGSPDASFSAGSGPTLWVGVQVLTLLPDGDLLIGGGFDFVNGLPNRFIARLNGGIARPVLLPPVRLGGGELRIMALTKEPAMDFILETSTNLLDWQPLGLPGTASNGLLIFDTPDTHRDHRFYRGLLRP